MPSSFWIDHFSDSRAEILQILALVFWKNWRHQNFLLKLTDLYCKENLVDIQGFIWVYPNGASYLHMKHAHDMQNADTEYPFCWLEARHSSWLLAFFAIKLIHELSCIYQTYIIHNISKALDLQIKYTEIDLFFSIYPIRCIRMHARTVWLCIFHSALQ